MGLILVFDLDQTIIDSSDPYLFNRPNTLDGIRELKFRAKGLLNFRLVNDVIKRAARLRGKKDSSGNDLLSGIFLLTNNSSKIMVSSVDSVLFEEVKANNPENPELAKGKYMSPYNTDPDTEGMPSQAYFFDSIMMREHKDRIPGADSHSPVKNLEDVKKMLGFIGVAMSDEEIQKNTFFFDDMDHPGMTLGQQYIRIDPPFRKYSIDYTRYEPILQRLSELDGQPMIRIAPRLRKPLSVSTPVEPLKPPREFGRNRSGTMNEGAGNNMELPPTKQETTVRAIPKAKPSLSSMFTAKPSPSGQSQYRPRPGELMENFMKRMGLNNNASGGRRKTRLRRKNSRNKSRKRLRK
jgi:hypothetical protein